MGRVKHLESDGESEELMDVASVRSKRQRTAASSFSDEAVPASATSDRAQSLFTSGGAGSIGAAMPSSAGMSNVSTVSLVGWDAGLRLEHGGLPLGVPVATGAEPMIPTKQIDFSQVTKDLGVITSTMAVPNNFVSLLMTQEHRQLLAAESGANIEWAPAEAKVHISGSAEQVKQGSKLMNRVNTHCLWGLSAEKVRRLIKPRKVESVQCRLSPMGTLPGYRKLLTPADRMIAVGKGPNNNLIIPGSGIVSRVHCIIELDEERGAVYVHDCSTNGTYLNGIRLPAQQSGKILLSHGDELLFREKTAGLDEFGYIVNLQEISVRTEMKLEAPRRLLTAEESSISRDYR